MRQSQKSTCVPTSLPTIVIPDNATYYGGIARFSIESAQGRIKVEAGQCDSLFCRGTPEALIAYGLIRQEWLPGQPTTNATSQRVVFEADGPRLILGKPRGKQPTAPRIIIRAWGLARRTVDVQIPISPEQEKRIKVLKAEWEHAKAEQEVRWAPPTPSDWRRDSLSDDRSLAEFRGNLATARRSQEPPTNIVPLALVKRKPRPCEDTVEVLRELLRMAESGDLIGLSYTVILNSRSWTYGTTGEATHTPAFTMGLLQTQVTELAHRITGGFKN